MTITKLSNKEVNKESYLDILKTVEQFVSMDWVISWLLI